jgi:hypothetical protein
MLGALIGAGAVWFYGPQIREFLNDQTQAARSRAAESLQAASEGLQSAKDRLEGGLTGGETVRRTG